MSNWIKQSGFDTEVSHITNDFREAYKEPPKYKFRALCTSYACTEKVEHGFIVLDVDKSKDFCPKCGSAIFWERYL